MLNTPPAIKSKEGEGVSHSRVFKTDYEKQLSATRGNECVAKIYFQEEDLKLFISQITSQGNNRGEIVNISGHVVSISKRNNIKHDNLSQNEKVNRHDSLNKFEVEISNGNGVN